VANPNFAEVESSHALLIGSGGVSGPGTSTSVLSVEVNFGIQHPTAEQSQAPETVVDLRG
jgi:hypothetical protein